MYMSSLCSTGMVLKIFSSHVALLRRLAGSQLGMFETNFSNKIAEPETLAAKSIDKTARAKQ